MHARTSFALLVCWISATVAQAQTAAPDCQVDVSRPGAVVAPICRGQQLEEFNHQFQGGLYAQLIHNPSFEEIGSPITAWSVLQHGDSRGDLAAQTAAETTLLNGAQGPLRQACRCFGGLRPCRPGQRRLLGNCAPGCHHLPALFLGQAWSEFSGHRPGCLGEQRWRSLRAIRSLPTRHRLAALSMRPDHQRRFAGYRHEPFSCSMPRRPGSCSSTS